MGIARSRWVLFLGISFLVFSTILVNIAGAQGIQQSPYSGPSILRGPGLGPSNTLGLPGSTLGPSGGSESLYVSDGMLRGILPLIPNLQFGYLYDFGNNRVNQGRFTADYLFPYSLGAYSEVFGEAHTEILDFWNTLTSVFRSRTTTTETTTTDKNGFNNRVDLSFGGGYRTFLRRDTLLGINGFYDTSRLGGTWYSSGGLGFEMAALIGGNDAFDFNFNWYGQLFNSNVIINAFRYGPSNFDFQAGYSHELWNGGPDFRLSATGYKFDIGESVWGWNTGAELMTRDNMFVLKYAVGNDKVDRTYQTVGGFVNVGFQLENIFRGESPFTKPEPIFNSPRHRRYMLTQKVRRNWHQPTAVVAARTSTCSLPGSAVLSSLIPAFHGSFLDLVATTPPIPVITTLDATVWWCHYTGPATSINLYILDGTNYWVAVFVLTPGSGSARLTLSPRGPFGFNGLGIEPTSVALTTFSFEPGGGISVQVNQ